VVLQTAVGLASVGLGCLHFVARGRRPVTRSFYLGSAVSSSTLRTVLALVEVSCGFVLLFTA
jgi:hypothetical protein